MARKRESGVCSVSRGLSSGRAQHGPEAAALRPRHTSLLRANRAGPPGWRQTGGAEASGRQRTQTDDSYALVAGMACELAACQRPPSSVYFRLLDVGLGVGRADHDREIDRQAD